MKPAVTFIRLGKLGRLGNCLHQISATVGIARLVDRPVVLPPWEYAPFFSIPEDWFAESWNDPRLSQAEDDVALAYGLWPNPKPSRRWIKYLQSPSLWSHCADEISGIFQPSARAQAVLASLPEPEPDDVALHVRRTDYATRPDHLPMLPESYYDAAVFGYTNAKGSVDVFTDDPEWCAANLYEWPVVSMQADGDEPTDWLDLFRMARYRNLVIANSSYSWWAAFLAGPEATVCYPSVWFGPKIDVASPALPEWIEVPA